ncbi:MAG: TerB family tellurite resistance protein [Cytophagaceae bacterium]
MLTLFETKKTKAQKSHLKNIINLAKADGYMSDLEIDYIFRLGEKMKFSAEEIEDLIEDSASNIFVKPSNDSERFDQLFDLVSLMLADGIIEDSEMDFCIDMAKRMGVRNSITGVLVRKIVMDQQNGIAKNEIKEQTKNFLLI